MLLMTQKNPCRDQKMRWKATSAELVRRKMTAENNRNWRALTSMDLFFATQRNKRYSPERGQLLLLRSSSSSKKPGRLRGGSLVNKAKNKGKRNSVRIPRIESPWRHVLTHLVRVRSNSPWSTCPLSLSINYFLSLDVNGCGGHQLIPHETCLFPAPSDSILSPMTLSRSPLQRAAVFCPLF